VTCTIYIGTHYTALKQQTQYQINTKSNTVSN